MPGLLTLGATLGPVLTSPQPPQVRGAYDRLSDPDSRILYDMHGHQAASETASKQRGGEAAVQFTVSLADFYTGARRSMHISRRVVCKGCRKDVPGSSQLRRCQGCGECPGEIKPVKVQLAPGFVIQQQHEVPSDERCVQQQHELKLRIRRGMSDGDVLTFARASEQRPGMVPGDVKVSLKQEKDARFRRRGRELHMDLEITLREALLGFRREIRHLDGHLVQLERSGLVTKPGEVVRIRGEGMPARADDDDDDEQHDAAADADAAGRAMRGAGSLHVTIAVAFPDALDTEAREWAARVLPQ